MITVTCAQGHRVNLYDTDEVATRLGLVRATVQLLCFRAGYGYRIGRDRVFTEEDIADMRARRVPSRPGRQPKYSPEAMETR